MGVVIYSFFFSLNEKKIFFSFIFFLIRMEKVINFCLLWGIAYKDEKFKNILFFFFLLMIRKIILFLFFFFFLFSERKNKIFSYYHFLDGVVFSDWWNILLLLPLKNKKETRLGLQCQTPLRYYPLSLIPFPFSVFPFSLSLIPHLISIIPTPCCLSPSTVLFMKFRWGLLLFLSLLFLWLWLSQAKVKSTPSPRPRTGVWQYFF